MKIPKTFPSFEDLMLGMGDDLDDDMEGLEDLPDQKPRKTVYVAS